MYERLPEFYVTCGMIGHGDRDCVLPFPPEEDRQYGDWLKASPRKGYQLRNVAEREKEEEMLANLGAKAGHFQQSSPTKSTASSSSPSGVRRSLHTILDELNTQQDVAVSSRPVGEKVAASGIRSSMQCAVHSGNISAAKAPAGLLVSGGGECTGKETSLVGTGEGDIRWFGKICGDRGLEGSSRSTGAGSKGGRCWLRRPREVKGNVEGELGELGELGAKGEVWMKRKFGSDGDVEMEDGEEDNGGKRMKEYGMLILFERPEVTDEVSPGRLSQ